VALGAVRRAYLYCVLHSGTRSLVSVWPRNSQGFRAIGACTVRVIPYKAVGNTSVRVSQDGREIQFATRETRNAWLKSQTGRVSRYRRTLRGGT
jgi:hypothetical protein